MDLPIKLMNWPANPDNWLPAPDMSSVMMTADITVERMLREKAAFCAVYDPETYFLLGYFGFGPNNTGEE